MKDNSLGLQGVNENLVEESEKYNLEVSCAGNFWVGEWGHSTYHFFPPHGPQ